MGGVLQGAAEMMKEMNKACNGPEITGLMRNLNKEMNTMGLMGEMMDEAVEGIAPPEEGEVDALVNAVMFESTGGKLGVRGPLPQGMKDTVPGGAAVAAAPARAALAGEM